MGYRLQLREISWPAEAPLGQPLVVETAWANAGVAPCYGGGFYAWTLKDEKGGIISAHVDESFDMKTLKTAPPEQALPTKLQSRFTVALRLGETNNLHASPAQPGTYDVFVSVGQRDGTPRLAMPLPGHDGQRRYKLGQIRLTQRE